jgi:hypothetical protein
MNKLATRLLEAIPDPRNLPDVAPSGRSSPNVLVVTEFGCSWEQARPITQGDADEWMGMSREASAEMAANIGELLLVADF